MGSAEDGNGRGWPGRLEAEIALARINADLDLRERARRSAPRTTRASFGAGERYAHARMAALARELALECATDFAGNLYMTLPGRDRAAPRIAGWTSSTACRMAGTMTARPA